MNLRQLRKQDKRAALVLISIHGYSPDSFGEDCQGRFNYYFLSSPLDNEWDVTPALCKWRNVRAWEHPNACLWYGFDPETGQDIAPAQRPRGLTMREARQWYRLLATPSGWRWRGKRLVRVGAHGEMVDDVPINRVRVAAQSQK